MEETFRGILSVHVQMQKFEWIVTGPSLSELDPVIHSPQTGAVMEWKEGTAEHVSGTDTNGFSVCIQQTLLEIWINPIPNILQN